MKHAYQFKSAEALRARMLSRETFVTEVRDAYLYHTSQEKGACRSTTKQTALLLDLSGVTCGFRQSRIPPATFVFTTPFRHRSIFKATKSATDCDSPRLEQSPRLINSPTLRQTWPGE